MSLFVAYAVPILGSYFFLFCLLWGMQQVSETKGKVGKKRLLLSFLFTTLVLLLCAVGGAVINLLTLLLVPFFGMYINESGKKSLVYSFLMAVITYLLGVFVSYVWYLLIVRGMFDFHSQELYILALNMTIRLMQFLAVRLLVLLARRKNGGHITGKQLAEALILPAFSILDIMTLLIFMQIYLTSLMLVLFMVNMAFLISINIWFAVLLDTMSENNRLENEVSLLKQQARYETAYYKREEQKYENSRKVIHDIRNHILALEQLCHGEDNQKAGTYAKHLHEMLNGLGQTYYTSERLLNIILNDKAEQMRQCGIKEDWKVGDVDLSFMQDTDMTTIFANLLDNAIAAAREQADGVITLRVRQINRFLSISVENTAKQKPICGKDGLLSSKAGHEGLGLKNVKQAVAHYAGDMRYEWANGVFSIEILLTMPDIQIGGE